MGLIGDITGAGALFDFASKIVDKIFPDKDKANQVKLDLFKAQQDGELKEMEQSFQLTLAQIATNTEEAKSSSTFVAGWRPFVGWVCGFALAYNYILFPLYSYTAQWISKDAPAMPALALGELLTLLIGMLGLGGLRSLDKYNNNNATIAALPPKT
jgi:hypothetical protein